MKLRPLQKWLALQKEHPPQADNHLKNPKLKKHHK